MNTDKLILSAKKAVFIAFVVTTSVAFPSLRTPAARYAAAAAGKSAPILSLWFLLGIFTVTFFIALVINYS